MDLILCDSLAMRAINYPKKRHYRLVAPEFVSAAAEWFFEPRVVDKQVRSWRVGPAADGGGRIGISRRARLKTKAEEMWRIGICGSL